jgi:hypothetical protein
MAASIIIDEELGTSDGYLHPHNGYYAGDFYPSFTDTQSSTSQDW